MTEQAPPKYLPFPSIQFNPAYYDQEIDNNITRVEVSKEYIKLPTNTPTTGNILKVSDATTTPPTTVWQDFAVIFPDYVSYDNVNEKIINNALTSYNIDNLNLQQLKVNVIGQIGQLFTLPNNSSTASVGHVLSILNASTKTTQWIPQNAPVTNYTNYDNTAKTLISNVSSTPTTITDLVMSASIGSSTAQKFILPSNSSTATLNSVLTLSNITTKATTWTVIPQITNYANYDNTAKTLISNVSSTPTTITDLVMSASIGSSTAQKFILPSNSSTATLNSVLTLSNITTKSTTWTVIPQITNYTNYDNTSKTLISNVSSTPTTITDLVMSASIGSSTAQKFILPSNSSTATLNSVLTLSNTTTKATTWTVIPIINNYMSYNTSTNQIINNVSGTTTTISGLNIGNLTCNAIDTQNSTINCGGGDVNAGTITASVNLVSTGGASVSGLSSLTGGIIIDAVNDYKFTSAGAIRGTTINGTILSASTQLTTSTINPFSPTSVFNFCNNQTGLINIGSATNRTGAIGIGNSSGAINIGTLTPSGTIQAITIGSTTADANQTITINRPLTCKSIDTQSNNITCAGINSSGSIIALTGNVVATTGNIDATTGTVNCLNFASTGDGPSNGARCQRFTCTGLNNMFIKGFISSSGGDLIIKDSGAIERASILSTGAITGTSLNAGSGLISTSGSISGHTITASSNLVSTGGIVVKIGVNNTVQIENSGQFICKNIIVRDPITLTQYFSVSASGDLLGNGCDFVRFQSTELNIFNTLSGGTFGSLQASINNAGKLTCKGIDAGSLLIETTSGIQAAYTDILGVVYNKGIIVRDSTYTIEQASINNAGKLTCKGVDAGTLQIKTTGEVRCSQLIVDNTSSIATVLITTDGSIVARNISVAPLGSTLPSAYMLTTGAIGGTSLTVGTGNITGGLADIQNLKIAPSIVTDTSYIGYTYSVTSTTINYNSGNTRAIDLNNGNLVNNANYLVRYQVLLNSGATSRNLTSIGHGLTNSGSTVTTVNGMKYEEGCFTYEKLNAGAEVINNRMFQGSFFYRYNSDNAYTVACVCNFTITGSISLNIKAFAIRIG